MYLNAMRPTRAMVEVWRSLFGLIGVLIVAVVAADATLWRRNNLNGVGCLRLVDRWPRPRWPPC